MATKLFDLTGKIALVSGASRGIGAAIATLFAEQGAHVIVSSRKLDGCQTVADEIVAAGGSAEALACHIGKLEDIEKTFATLRERHGRLDILINNVLQTPILGRYLKPITALSPRPSKLIYADTFSCLSRQGG